MAASVGRDDDEFEILPDEVPATKDAPGRKKPSAKRRPLIASVSADDSDEAWGEPSTGRSDADYEAERPPHW